MVDQSLRTFLALGSEHNRSRTSIYYLTCSLASSFWEFTTPISSSRIVFLSCLMSAVVLTAVR
eukprot:scaffold267489_cov13-Tisochrysis_lutea.AAC.1